MQTKPADILACVKAELPQAQARLTDLRGDGRHYFLEVCCPSFSNLSRLDQHRAVYRALKSLPEGGPSLSLQTSAA